MHPFLGEIRMMAFDFAPRYWAACDGQVVPVSQNPKLASLLRNYYGGDGTNTFGLPDLRGAAAIHRSPEFPQGAKGGEAAVTLHWNQVVVPDPHTHGVRVSNDAADTAVPRDAVLKAATANVYARYDGTKQVELPAATVQSVGGVPHENMAPYVAVTFAIALDGLFPIRP